MALTKSCCVNAAKVSWRRTTCLGVPDQDHAPSNSAQEYHGGERYKRTGYLGRIMREETCRHSPVGGGIPMLCGMSVVVGGLYIAAVCLENPARYYKILRIFLSLVTRNGLDRSGIKIWPACSFWNGDDWNVCLRADGNYP